ncbi:MAG: phosphoesterase RecJ-like protein [Candidatus Paceibacteria bacterium]|jgi:phosphoesterase RecJ-like protein
MTQSQSKTSEEAQERALNLLREGQRFVLSGHMRPDGDCLGAEAALAGVLRALGKEVWIVNPDPIEHQFDYLARHNKYISWNGGALPSHDVSVLLDCSELSRCGRLGPAIEGMDSQKLVIDHHIHMGEDWWDEAYVDVTASATGLLVFRIAKQLGVELDQSAAEGVFTSIVTDTGWFKYSNTDGETLRVAGELVERGVDSSALYSSIYQRHHRTHPLDTGIILGTTEYHVGGRLAVICAPRDGDQAAASPDSDDALDILRSVGRVEVVLFLRELGSGMVKLSARSKTDYDVNALASEFGGGGHKKASGATIEGNLQDVSARLVHSAESRFEALVDGAR